MCEKWLLGGFSAANRAAALKYFENAFVAKLLQCGAVLTGEIGV
jgi:hypothetical protein